MSYSYQSVHIYSDVYIHMYMYVCACVYIYMYVYMYMYIYIQRGEVMARSISYQYVSQDAPHGMPIRMSNGV